MRRFLRWFRRHEPRPSVEAIRANEQADVAVKRADQRLKDTQRAAAQLRTHLRANRFDEMLANTLRRS